MGEQLTHGFLNSVGLEGSCKPVCFRCIGRSAGVLCGGAATAARQGSGRKPGPPACERVN